MLSGKILPAHPKPFHDELISSWLARLAEANGIKYYSLMHLLFGDRFSPWQYDVDRRSPRLLLRRIGSKTGARPWGVRTNSLIAFRKRLYPVRQQCGQLRWILPLGVESSRRGLYGLQFCPACLAEDREPYYRVYWRVGLFTFCPKHECMLLDACPVCGAPVVLHRRDVGRDLWDCPELAFCHKCKADYRIAPKTSANLHPAVYATHKRVLESLMEGPKIGNLYGLSFFAVLHQLCKVLGASDNKGKLYKWTRERIGSGLPDIDPRRVTVEIRRVEERHTLVSAALWLMAGRERIRDAWRDKAVRYNLLLKDFDDAPSWYIRCFEDQNRNTKKVLHAGDHFASNHSGCPQFCSDHT